MTHLNIHPALSDLEIPSQIIRDLAELEQTYQNCPLGKIPVQVLIEERRLRQELIEANKKRELEYGLDDLPVELGSPRRVAIELLLEYVLKRGFVEGGGYEQLLEEDPDTAEEELGQLSEEAEELFYAAESLLLVDDLGDELDNLARKAGFSSYEALEKESGRALDKLSESAR